MGFYGDISKDISSTIHDKIYPNKTIMDNAVDTDRIFIGRYVYINYDTEITDECTVLYQFQSNLYKNNYSSKIDSADGIACLKSFIDSEIYIIKQLDVNEEIEDTKYYLGTEELTGDSIKAINIEIDKNTDYNLTTWKKIYKDNKERYEEVE